GSALSEGDAAQRADIARNTFGFTGSGVKIGVLSDSFNTSGNGSYAADQASGDLPAGVQVIADYSDPTPGTDPSDDPTDEGRAMLQLAYDTAPGSSLAFATAYNTPADLANNIKALRNNGCKVI